MSTATLPVQTGAISADTSAPSAPVADGGNQELVHQFASMSPEDREALLRGEVKPPASAPEGKPPVPAPDGQTPNPDPAAEGSDAPAGQQTHAPAREKDHARIRFSKETLQKPYNAAVLDVLKLNPDLDLDRDFDTVDRMAREKAGLPARQTAAPAKPGTTAAPDPKADAPPPSDPIAQLESEIAELNGQLDEADAEVSVKKAVQIANEISERKQRIKELKQEQEKSAQAQEQQQDAAFQTEYEKHRKSAIEEFPEAADEKGALREKIRELTAQYEQENDPILDSPRFALLVTREAASLLGLPPLKLRSQQVPRSGDKRFAPPLGGASTLPTPTDSKPVTGADAFAALEGLSPHEQIEAMGAALSAAHQAAVKSR